MRYALLVLLLAPCAHAQERDRSYYDGRAPAEEDAGLWVPRVLLAPLWLAWEGMIREPQRFLYGAIDNRSSSIEVEAEPDLQLLPMFAIESDRLAMSGIYFRAADWIDGAELLTWIEHWDHQRLYGRIELRSSIAPRAVLSIAAHGDHRADAMYYGLGWQAHERARFTRNAGHVRVAITARPWRRSRIGAWIDAGVRRYQGTSFAENEPSLEALVQSGQRAAPGWPGYTAVRQGLRAVLDTREEHDPHGGGMRVAVRAHQGVEVERGSGWLYVEGELAGAVRLTDEHALSLDVGSAFAPSIGGETPFEELASLGGTRMAGFVPRAMLGESALHARLRYRWGIWSDADAYLDVESGNTFGPALEGFALERLRASFAIGIDGIAHGEHMFRALVGVGTDPFAEGGAPSSIHATITIGRIRG